MSRTFQTGQVFGCTKPWGNREGWALLMLPSKTPLPTTVQFQGPKLLRLRWGKLGQRLRLPAQPWAAAKGLALWFKHCQSLSWLGLDPGMAAVDRGCCCGIPFILGRPAEATTAYHIPHIAPWHIMLAKEGLPFRDGPDSDSRATKHSTRTSTCS